MQLSGSVGHKGRNSRKDVSLVQQLINRSIRVPGRLLDVDQFMGPFTIRFLKDFQSQVAGFRRPDGLVEPNGKTWAALERYAHEVPTYTRGIFLAHNKTPQVKPVSVAKTKPVPESVARMSASSSAIAWGKKVSLTFKSKVKKIAADLGVSPDFLMACMAFETGETFSPSIKNAAGSGAVGLIQFMPPTAKWLGTSVDDLAVMSAEEQLDYVEKFFKKFRKNLKTLEDVYLLILYPAAVGKPESYELFKEGTKKYSQNSGFDKNKDGIITPAEISVKVRAAYNKGLKKGYLG